MTELNSTVLEKIKQLEKKYATAGQDLTSHLEGLLHTDYLTYWDYIHLDTLLSLQNPKTSFKDEKIFIIYHQITELYFQLCLHELEQIAENESLELDWLKERVRRLVKYFEALIGSFGVMVEGMEKEQFLQFRMALLPSSGFQSAQYRMIEMHTTSLRNLVNVDVRNQMPENATQKELYDKIYWRTGATELATGKKTLTLKQFELKYDKRLLELAKDVEGRTLDAVSKPFQSDSELVDLLKEFDLCVNVKWPLMHYKSAVRYLEKKPMEIAATGGTNWQKYLPPRYQLRIFFPQLWTVEEKQEWGKFS